MANGFRWQIAQRAELKWWQNYLKKQDKATYLKWKRHYWKTLLNRLDPPLDLSEDARVLDAGCGPAGVFIVLNRCPVDAVDPLLDAYDNNLPHFQKKDYPNVRFITRPLEQFQKAESYDVIFCMNAINHVARLDVCLDNLVQSLKAGGRLVLTIDAHNYRGFKHLFRLIPGDILHPHQYNLEEYRQLLSERGLEITQTLKIKSAFFFDHYVLAARKPER